MWVSGGCSEVGRVLLPSHSRTTWRLACTPSPCPHPADNKKKSSVVGQTECGSAIRSSCALPGSTPVFDLCLQPAAAALTRCTDPDTSTV